MQKKVRAWSLADDFFEGLFAISPQAKNPLFHFQGLLIAYKEVYLPVEWFDPSLPASREKCIKSSKISRLISKNKPGLNCSFL